jgi:hypothetical protein
MLKNVNNETAPKLKYILKNNKTRNNLLPYEIITAITTEE